MYLILKGKFGIKIYGIWYKKKSGIKEVFMLSILFVSLMFIIF